MEGDIRTAPLLLTRRLILRLLIAILLLSVAPIMQAELGSKPTAGNSSLAFSPDSTLLAFAPRDYGPVRIYDVASGQPVRIMEVPSTVSDLQFSPGGELIAASVHLSLNQTDGRIYVWNSTTGEELNRIRTPIVYFLRFASDGETIFYHHFSIVHAWNVEATESQPTAMDVFAVTHASDIGAYWDGPSWFEAVHAQSGIYATSVTDNPTEIVIHDGSTREVLHRLAAEPTVSSLFFSEDGEQLAAVCRDEESVVRVWATSTWESEILLARDAPIIEACFNSAADLLALHLGDDTVELVDLESGEVLSRFGSLLPERRLCRAASDRDLATVRELIALGADVNLAAGPPSEPTPLSAASRNGHLDVVKELLAAGADPNRLNGYALGLALEREYSEIVRALAAAGADLDSEYVSGLTFLAQMIYYGASREVGQLLMELGADPNATAGSGITALEAAVRTKNLNYVRILLEAGADPHQPNSRGVTPAQLAAESDDLELRALFAEL